MSQFETFVQLHKPGDPLLIGNIWDVASALLLEENGFKALASSSAAMANAAGYEDGENMPFQLLLDMVKRIKNSISLPFSVDMEKGYSDTISGITDNIKMLHDIGIVGINIEDSSAENNNSLQPAKIFEKNLLAITNQLSKENIKIFVNVRTDAFLVNLPGALAETIQRAKCYESAGATGIFAPFIAAEDDIQQLVAATSLPLNVLSVPALPDFATLSSLGVGRISLGSSLYRAVNKELVNKLQLIRKHQSVTSLF